MPQDALMVTPTGAPLEFELPAPWYLMKVDPVTGTYIIVKPAEKPEK
jgi:hypothetical protein